MSANGYRQFFCIIFTCICSTLVFPALTTPQPQRSPAHFPVEDPARTLSLPTPNAKQNKFTAEIRNKITKKMTGYRRMGTWYPEFTLTANGVLCPYDEPRTIPCPKGIVHLIFTYDFKPMGKSYRKGTEEFRYALTNTHEAFQIAFSWQHSPRLIVETESNKKVEGSSVRS